MAIFGVEVEDSEKTEKFFRETNERILNANFMRSPFAGKVMKFGSTNMIYMEPLIWPFPKVLAFITIGGMVVFGFHYWQIPFIVLSLMWFFWSKWFFYIVLRKGLRKEKYYGSIKLISASKILKKEVIDSGSDGDTEPFEREEKRDKRVV